MDVPEPRREPLPVRWVDVAVRLSLLGGLLVWSFFIVRPFVGFIVWGGILAVALYPTYERIQSALGGRRKAAASLFVVVPLLLIAVPTAALVETLLSGVVRLNQEYEAGQLVVPAPPERIEGWPFIGERLFEAWQRAHDDLQSAIATYAPYLERGRAFLVRSVREVAVALLGFLFSLGVMGLFLVNAEIVEKGTRALLNRVEPEHGDALVSLARDTTRSVAQGIVGTAVIQSLVAGLGFLVVGVPAAGLWALVLLVLAVAQIPALLVLGPVAIWVFGHAETWVAVSFAVFAVIVGLLDNVLKPILLGRGVGVPMLVVFSGAIGGMLLQGVVGLFVGPVVLAMTFTIVRAWVLEAKRGSAAEP